MSTPRPGPGAARDPAAGPAEGPAEGPEGGPAGGYRGGRQGDGDGAAGARCRILRPVVDLCRHPGAPRERQLLFGESVTVDDRRDGWALVRAGRDGYRGFVRAAALGPARAATHRVAAAATHLYAAPDMKAPERATLSFGSLLTVTGARGRFLETPEGFVPLPHLRALGEPPDDPVAVAEILLGTPYLWGGNSVWGIDCSGLVQAAFLACGRACPGDSGPQMEALATRLPPGGEPARGELLFWKGHVAIAAGDGDIVHANAFHMAVVREPLEAARARIERQGDGPVIARGRLP